MKTTSRSSDNELHLKTWGKPLHTSNFSGQSYQPPNLAWNVPHPASRPRTSRPLDTGLSKLNSPSKTNTAEDSGFGLLKSARGKAMGSDILFDSHEQFLEVRTGDLEYPSRQKSNLKDQDTQEQATREGHPELQSKVMSVKPNFSENYRATVGELNRLSVRERKKSNRFYSASDRTKQLEEERQRYDELEKTYLALLKDVEALQSVHISEVSTERKKSSRDIKALRKAIDLKAMETVDLNRQLQEWQARYADESALWIAANEKLQDQVNPLKDQNAELQRALHEREQRIQNLQQELLTLRAQLDGKREELNRYVQSFRRTEEDWNREREAWLILKVELSESDRTLSNLRTENQHLKHAYAKSQAALQDISAMKPVMEEAKKKINDLLAREKEMGSSLEIAGKRERALTKESESLRNRLHQTGKELDSANHRFSVAKQDLQSKQSSIKDLEMQIEDWKSRHAKLTDHLMETQQSVNSETKEKLAKEEQVRGLESLVRELRRQEHLLKEDLLEAKLSMDALRTEKDKLLEQKTRLDSTVAIQKQDLYDLQNKVYELNLSLDAEKASKGELKQQNSEKLTQVTKRIGDLQSTVKEALDQVSTLQESESLLREDIQKRDDLLRERDAETLRLSKHIAQLEAKLTMQVRSFEDITKQRKSELVRLESTFQDSQSELYDQVTVLSAQLTEKSKDITKAMEMAAEAKLQLSHTLTEKTGLESKIAEFHAENSSLKRQLGHSESLQSTLLSEKDRLQSKVSKLEQEITMLKKELDISQNGSSRPLSDVSRIQAHMNSLSKKVQEQVETLLEEDEEERQEAVTQESHSNPLSVAAKRQRAASLFSTPSNPSTPRSTSPGRRSFFIKPS